MTKLNFAPVSCIVFEPIQLSIPPILTWNDTKQQYTILKLLEETLSAKPRMLNRSCSLPPHSFTQSTHSLVKFY